MITKTRWERFLWWFANQSAQLAYNTVCENNTDWEIASCELRTKDRRSVIRFNRSLTWFTVVLPIRQSLGLFGSLMLSSLVKRIMISHLQQQFKKSKHVSNTKTQT